ncbi:hypothetical protein ACFE04_030863 [Oxalis oulophora]
MSSSVSDISQFIHTPFYCEENVYMLCKTLCTNGIVDAAGADLFVVFISNDKKQIPLWHQKASKRADGIILWDYHVICVQKRKGDTDLVWDLDSSLQFPCPLAMYASETIRPGAQLFPEYQRFFRVVHAPLFLRHFASDRRHMKGPDGKWTAQPPTYEPIVAEDGTVHNLSEYMEINSKDEIASLSTEVTNEIFTRNLGIIVDENKLVELFSHLSS